MILLDDIIIKENNKANYVALGSFDGLHVGHLSLIRKAIYVAKERNGNSMVFTYKNHPLSIIKPEFAPKFIMNLQYKLECLKNENVDVVVIRTFTKEFMQMSPEEFVRILSVDYNVKGIIVGFNFKFGHKNEGDIELLKNLKEKYGYELWVIDPLKYKEEVISSTRIRKSILEGKVNEARNMLSRPYSIRGKVKHGKKLGRTIGFPTANLGFDERMVIPKIGVYYTNVIWNNSIFKGITSVGHNPTVNGQDLTIETYILEFDSEIYGQEIEVLFLERIRDEKKFQSLDALVEKLKKDKEFAIKSKIFIKNIKF
ncbi:bifunctional riboflavin kinase/FAD synthetase [Clostridium gasigenes]|uniref:Riboflavin biosynthesis protein n=1 Tax=Clostridium gasigenes TaxID=94869 RepID=A0A7X0VRK6_9CLOT|nr:bifunctional riboflavin kinase/FAD synthetase [Clostridium gasigenes]MBB6715083.1 bifunctional riboflavin kinase/FAD synthetase [Clostridium gasigenes]MBU3107094.1 bifunctional riboflavin kinase/FAD synthetase [Clostridium gasigenes]